MRGKYDPRRHVSKDLYVLKGKRERKKHVDPEEAKETMGKMSKERSRKV